MPEIPRDHARTALGIGALGIGEHHDNDDGRNLTCELLDQGLVRALFLEGKSQSQYVIQNAQQSQGDHSKIQKECRGIIAPEHGAKISVSDVAAQAVWHNVPVYCIDVYASDHGDPWLKDGHKEAVQIRDKEAAKLFERCVKLLHGGNRRGCLVLFGAAHFTGTNGVWAKQDCLADYLHLCYILT